MARSHLTLAALATSAVSGLDVTAARILNGLGQGEYDSAVVTASDGAELVVRVPLSQSAETDQSSDLLALRALSTGVRARLPFDVPVYLGQTAVAGTRAVVTELVAGHHITSDEVSVGDGLAASIGRAVAAVHQLPTAFVGDAGLPSLSAADSRAAATSLIERAVATGLVPTGLRDRWRHAVGIEQAWQFQPAVVNGALSVDSVLVDGATVVGVLGWSSLKVGDPALDLHWMLSMSPEATEATLQAYHEARSESPDRRVRQRALLYTELEVARWLLHGRHVHDQAIVDDAVQMMDGLVDQVHQDIAVPLETQTGPIMAVTDVQRMLQTTPGAGEGERSQGLAPVEDAGGEPPLPENDEE